MSEEELIAYAFSKIGTQYKIVPPYSLDEGFNCLYWADHLYQLIGLTITDDLPPKVLRKKFKPIRFSIPQFGDMAMFYMDTMETRHVGFMLNPYEMSHCSRSTNGVAVSHIHRPPWINALKGIYRIK